MSILSGWLKTRAYRKTADGYKKESRDTSSETVYMNDGNTAETNLGDIKGITDSLTATSSNVALSAKGGNSLQGQIDTLNSNLSKINNFEIKILTRKATTSNVGTVSFTVRDELPNGGIFLLAYTANQNYWCRLYNITQEGVCTLGIADYDFVNSANTEHTIYSYWLVKKQ